MQTLNPTRYLAIVWLLITSFHLQAQSPGGVSTNLRLWLNANSGVTTLTGNVTAWSDRSSGANNASIVSGTNPTLTSAAINSYPAVNFGGAGGLGGAFGTAVTSSTVSSFIVTKINAASANSSGLFSITSSAGTDTATANSAALFEQRGTSIVSNRASATRGSSASATGAYHLYTTEFSSTQNLFFKEGAAATSAAYTAVALNAVNYNIGARRNPNAGSYATSQIAEVILYDRLVTAAEKSSIESYLALKYGMTLSQSTATNYTNSAGTVIWSATTNSSYPNNIFGVGTDNSSGLSQAASTSLNTTVLSISGSTPANNNFFIISDNGQSATQISAASGLPSGCTYRVGITYRASETGETGSESFTFTNPSNYYNPINLFTTPYMLVDTNADGVFERAIAATSSSGSNFTYSCNLPNGSLFSFGYIATIPPIDFGDAYNAPTTVAQSGAGHKIVAGVYLGAAVDAEADGIQSVNEMGDDSIGSADEDGVDFNIGVSTNGANILQIGMSNSIKVTASVAGYLNAWIDLNQNGSYTDHSEQVFTNYALTAGVNTISVNISDSVAYGSTSMRFRFAQNIGDVTSSYGLATNGEVEDYKVYITAPLAAACANTFQNPGFELGPAPGTYIITGDTNLPYWRTTAADKDIEVWKSGFNGVPAYSGNYFVELNANLPSALYQDVYTTPGSTIMWHFAHRGRAGTDVCELKIGVPGSTVQQFTASDGTTAWGSYAGSYLIPANQYITRFEFNALSSSGGNLSVGNFLDDIYVSTNFDYGDAPDTYGTLATSNGPIHNINTNLHLGTSVTCDASASPGVLANGDTGDDGVTFPAVCTSCSTYGVSVSVYNNTGSSATLAGWMDYNRNGVFDASERVSVVVPTSASQQTVTLTFSPTQSFFSTSSNKIYARFRIATLAAEVANPTGVATSGEVEDYLYTCGTMAIPVPVNNGPLCTRAALNITTTSTAPFFYWTGPASFSSTTKNLSITYTPITDSGSYRIYAFYADGCETDSATRVVINDCFVTLAGALFDDANGNGIIDGTDAKTNLSQTLYAVVTDTTGAVLTSGTIASAGTFTVTSVPANLPGMRLSVSTSSPTVGTTPSLPLWPSRWTGTFGTYGTNNLAGSGVNNNQKLALTTSTSNITGVLLGFDRVPSSTAVNKTITYPHHNAKQKLITANGLGILTGTDPEDGTISSSFKITDLSAMNANTLYYDINANDSLEPAEALATNSVITSYNANRLFVKYTGAASTMATFSYAALDAAGNADPTPSTYAIHWAGALPVKLLYFHAEKSGDASALLSWATASEIDNDHFDIERSGDGTQWLTLGQVKGQGNSNEQHQYSYADGHPLPFIDYYRLRQVDIDGHEDYSDIASLSFGDIHMGDGISIFPNPLHKNSVLNILSANAGEPLSRVSITTAMGQEIYSGALSGKLNASIAGLNLSGGVYMVTAVTASETSYSVRIVVEP